MADDSSRIYLMVFEQLELVRTHVFPELNAGERERLLLFYEQLLDDLEAARTPEERGLVLERAMARLGGVLVPSAASRLH